MGFMELFEWMQTHLDVLVTILGAGVAVLSALFASRETRRQRKIQTETLRSNIDAASLNWGNAAIDTLGRAATLARTRHLYQHDLAFRSAQVNAVTALSALVERGRMFFPNIEEDGKGAEKDGAYRGSRPPILDALMFAYYELNALTRDGGPTGDNSADFIDDCRRLMVSELQAHLDPRRRDAVVGRYDTQNAAHRSDAIQRSSSLKAALATRRPGLTIDGERTQTTRTPETVQ